MTTYVSNFIKNHPETSGIYFFSNCSSRLFAIQQTETMNRFYHVFGRPQSTILWNHSSKSQKRPFLL